MGLNARKLLTVPEKGPLHPLKASSPTPDSGRSPLIRMKSSEDNTVSNGVTANSYGGFSGYRFSPRAPFDNSMALMAVVLLFALFFLAFFSIYIRRFANDPTRSRSRRSSSSSGKGADRSTVDSLPEYRYSVDAKQGIVECAICLSELGEGEVVKAIPSCRHVFHVDCIETWLTSHVTCPLCRTARFFPPGEEGRVLIRCDAGGDVAVGGPGSTVDGRDTWREEAELRRSSTSSCSFVSERVVLRRSLSF